jgi:hypothetical protein
MPPTPSAAVSNSAADRAGNQFRAWYAADAAEQEPMFDDAVDAVRTIVRYRAIHAYPLRKVTVGVRTMIATELGPAAPRPGQRFKRIVVRST